MFFPAGRLTRAGYLSNAVSIAGQVQNCPKALPSVQKLKEQFLERGSVWFNRSIQDLLGDCPDFR